MSITRHIACYCAMFLWLIPGTSNAEPIYTADTGTFTIVPDGGSFSFAGPGIAVTANFDTMPPGPIFTPGVVESLHINLIGDAGFGAPGSALINGTEVAPITFYETFLFTNSVNFEIPVNAGANPTVPPIPLVFSDQFRACGADSATCRNVGAPTLFTLDVPPLPGTITLQFQNINSPGSPNEYILSNATFTTVPEPASWLLFGSGSLALLLVTRLRGKRVEQQFAHPVLSHIDVRNGSIDLHRCRKAQSWNFGRNSPRESRTRQIMSGAKAPAIGLHFAGEPGRDHSGPVEP